MVMMQIGIITILLTNIFMKYVIKCIPLKKSRITRKNTPQPPWILRGGFFFFFFFLIKSRPTNVNNKLYKRYLLRSTEGKSREYKIIVHK